MKSPSYMSTLLGGALLLLLAMPTLLPAAGDFGKRCSEDEGFVTSLYASILKRQPDDGGHEYWLKELRGGLSREQVIGRFFDSPEYQGFGRSNRDYARDLYAAVLGRTPDQDGHSYWIQKLSQGMSRSEVLRRFLDSPEYKGIVTACGGSAQERFMQRCAEDRAFVRSLYRSILKREPDGGGHEYWLKELRGGASREQVIGRFFSSPEYQGFGRNNRDYARDLYHGVLGREPDAQGLADWVRALDGGKNREQVLLGFLGSPEYKKLMRCK